MAVSGFDLFGGGGGIKGIQRGTTAMSAGVDEISVNISPIDPDRSIIMQTSRNVSGATEIATLITAGEIVDATTIKFYRAVATGSVEIAWVVVEFENVKSKQTGILNTTSSSIVTVTINPIDVDKSWLFVSMTNNLVGVQSIAPGAIPFYRIASATQIEMLSGGSQSKRFFWQVIEFN